MIMLTTLLFFSFFIWLVFKLIHTIFSATFGLLSIAGTVLMIIAAPLLIGTFLLVGASTAVIVPFLLLGAAGCLFRLADA